MGTRQLSRRKMWRVTTFSKVRLAQTDRDFLAELVSEEAHNASRGYDFVFHDMIESTYYCDLYVEASSTALENLLTMIESNTPYEIAITDLGKYNSPE